MYFPAKKDRWHYIFIWGLIGIIMVGYLFGKDVPGPQYPLFNHPLGYGIGCSSLVILLWIWIRTGYFIEGDVLKAQMGPYKRTIPISTIKEIDFVESSKPAVALARHRLVLRYGEKQEIQIAPLHQEVFLGAMKRMQPAVDIQTNSKPVSV